MTEETAVLEETEAAAPAEDAGTQRSVTELIVQLSNYVANNFDWDIRDETAVDTAIRIMERAKIAQAEAVAQAEKQLLERNLIETSRWHRSIVRTALLNHAEALGKAAKKDSELGMADHANGKLAEVEYIEETMLPKYQEQQSFQFDRQTPTEGDAAADPAQTDLVADAAAAQQAGPVYEALTLAFGACDEAPLPSGDIIAGWSEDERAAVLAYANAVHIAASSNDDCEVPEMPGVLRLWVEQHTAEVAAEEMQEHLDIAAEQAR